MGTSLLGTFILCAPQSTNTPHLCRPPSTFEEPAGHPDNVAAALIGGFVGLYLRELDAVATEAVPVSLSEVLPECSSDAGEDWGLHPPKQPVGIGHSVGLGWSESVKAS